MMDLFFSVLFFLLNTINCSYAVVNGTHASPFENPEVVRLILMDERYDDQSLSLAELSANDRCTGVAVSDHVVLTAGHCLVDEDNKRKTSIVLVRETEKHNFEQVNAVDFQTDFRNSNLKDISNLNLTAQNKNTPNAQSPVPGCSVGVRPLFKTETKDLGTVTFPAGTFKKWSQIQKGAELQLEDKIDYLGFGGQINSFAFSIPHLNISSEDLRAGTHTIKRMNEQRIAWVSTGLNSFADSGDSGAPVYFGGKVVAILSTVSEFCETELGDDYGILNTATRL